MLVTKQTHQNMTHESEEKNTATEICMIQEFRVTSQELKHQIGHKTLYNLVFTSKEWHQKILYILILIFI